MINKSLLLIFIFALVRFGSTQNVFVNPHGIKMQFACETCHTTADWNNIPGWKFNHDQTGFALFGSHKNTECRDCHQSLIFSQVGVSCIDCHTDVHKSELGIECENCHNSQSWENRSEIMNQHSQTNFPLTGVHANLDCESCHVNEQERQFATISVECQSCHLDDYMATLNPSHQKTNFDLDCRKCHLQVKTSWKTSSFIHPSTFQLNGAHKTVDCVDCHINQYRGISVECFSCHNSDFKAASNPDHSTFGFPTVCEECHSDISWERSVFDHLAESGFIIEGAHTEILCTDCHQNNQLTGLPIDCFGCHQDDYNLALDPHHVQNSFSEDCLECHSANGWEPASFAHANTQFPLTGAHNNINCTECHTTGYNQQLATDCFSCHELDFTTVSDPNHISNNFDHDCIVCHNTSVWAPAVFDHNITDFPLLGAHISINCISCHTASYQNTPMECIACHQADYDNTTDPGHASALFPNTCEDCHNSTAWDPAIWDHDGQYFPIYRGAHREQWDDCLDCHINPANYSQFTCTNCHQRVKMDDKHKEEPEYEYDSIRCYDCHPDGKGD